ncbi:MAG: class I SAM-dependent methyltransferase [Firmicutes bacterium HGW-Firmicutes-11]|jgi:ubiquinone/menaquinone biosynthesis C-methylase UbiE|nr:MAG: class I SAM-dependent methyltransferase [Firmicutes bacterium HGW-Firmicutes-11]
MDKFHRIAPIYSLFYQRQKREYRRVVGKMSKILDLHSFETMIDVGGGTGALCSVFNEAGFAVTCTERIERMMAVGRNKEENKTIRFVLADAIDGLPFPDKSFDIAISAFVAHGMQPEQRTRLYGEMSRVSKSLVILHDYNQNRSLLTDIVERMEGGDYPGFIKNVDSELNDYFHNLQMEDVGPRSAWYICRL